MKKGKYLKAKPTITGHMLIKNEDQFVWYAINSVLLSIDKFLITDTGSTDKTLPIISLIKSGKIRIKKTKAVDRGDLVKMRNLQIKSTKTDWILLVDGDEVWPEKQLKKLIKEIEKADEKVYAIVNKTRNVVGDIYHCQDVSAGKYSIGSTTGHLTIRAIRNMPGLEVRGVYPNESYEIKGVKLQNLDKNLVFCDAWYLHATHLKRSSDENAARNTIDRIKKFKFEHGIEMAVDDIPEVLKIKLTPPAIPRPQDIKLKGIVKFAATVVGFVKKIKRNLPI